MPPIFSIQSLTPPSYHGRAFFVLGYELSSCDVCTLASTWKTLVPELSI